MKRYLAIAIFGVLGAGCFGMAPSGPMETLSDSVRLYNDGVRWEKWEKAANFIPPKQRGSWVDDEDARAKDVKVTEYDVVRIEPQGDRHAEVHVKMSWYKNTELTVHETYSLQKWERRNKEWLLVDETRARGDEMPGLAEAPPVTATATGDSKTPSPPPSKD